MSEAPNAVARRGDLVVIHLCDRDWKTGEPLGDDEFWLGQVTSVTRAGLVRLYRPAGTFAGENDRRGRPDRGRPLPSLRSGRAMIKSQKEIDVQGALATAACRTWPGHEDHVRGYPRPRRGQGRAAPAPARPPQLGTAPRRRPRLGSRPARSRPAAERGGRCPRRGVHPPVGPLRRRRDRREQRLPRNARAGGAQRDALAAYVPRRLHEAWNPRRPPGGRQQ